MFDPELRFGGYGGGRLLYPTDGISNVQLWKQVRFGTATDHGMVVLTSLIVHPLWDDKQH